MFEDIMNGDKIDMTREEWICLYVLRVMNELVEKGFMTGNPVKFTEKGDQVLNEWLENNPHPTDEELEMGFNTMFRPKGDGKFELPWGDKTDE